MGYRMADRLENPWMSRFIEFEDADHVVGKLSAPHNITGKTLQELALPKNYATMVLVVERRGRKVLPVADLVIEEGDTLWLFGEKSRIALLIGK